MMATPKIEDARTRTETLDEAAIAAVRELYAKHGEEEAARLLQVSPQTTWRILAGLPVQRITAAHVRNRIAAIGNNQGE